jgi:hypothetical protein
MQSAAGVALRRMGANLGHGAPSLLELAIDPGGRHLADPPNTASSSKRGAPDPRCLANMDHRLTLEVRLALKCEVTTPQNGLPGAQDAVYSACTPRRSYVTSLVRLAVRLPQPGAGGDEYIAHAGVPGSAGPRAYSPHPSSCGQKSTLGSPLLPLPHLALAHTSVLPRPTADLTLLTRRV